MPGLRAVRIVLAAEVEKLAQLDALCARSRDEGLPLGVFHAYATFNRKRLPEVFMQIRKSAEFRVRRYTSRTFDGPDEPVADDGS